MSAPDARDLENIAYRREQFDAQQGKWNRDVERERIKAMREQTEEMRLLREAIERAFPLTPE